tara:strand:+ start:288 stop:407 length:120 start_codon:yes stop_codon:yes gene_type:complete
MAEIPLAESLKQNRNNQYMFLLCSASHEEMIKEHWKSET